MTRPPWLPTAVGMALSAVLSSGVTAAYLRLTAPDTVALRGDLLQTPEQRHLAALLVAPGEPFRPESDGGPVDAAALRADGLESLGFRRGWTRAWVAPDGQRVDAFVLEFAGPDGATGYARGIGRAATLLADPEPFTVAGVPTASGLADTVADANGRYAQVVVLHRGPWAALLVLQTVSAEPGEPIRALTQRQWAALRAT